MFDDLFSGLNPFERRQPRTKRATKRKAQPEGTHTFTVQKPYCAPARSVILAALTPYHVEVLDIKETITMTSLANAGKLMAVEMRTKENLRYGPAAAAFLPRAMQARVTVKKAQANLAEYSMERTGLLAVTGGSVNPRNREWADKHGGVMMRPWDADKGQLQLPATVQPRVEGGIVMEPGCTQALEVIESIKRASQQPKRSKR